MDKNVRSWILYDWANSTFALTTMAAFFPILFKDYWSQDSLVVTTARLGVGNSIAGLIVALFSPILAEIVVVGDKRQKGLMVAAFVGIIGNGALFFIPSGSWFWALFVFIIARVGFQSANLFYDALLPAVAAPSERHRISSLGYAFGYLGCAILFGINISMIQVPHFWGLSSALMGAKVSIVTVSVWWFLFAVPLWRAPLPKEHLGVQSESIRAIFTRLKGTIQFAFSHKPILYFLIAYWLYIDGVHSLILMAANFGRSLDFSVGTLMIALLVVQIVAFPSAWILGSVAIKRGARKVIAGTVILYIFIALGSSFLMREEIHFIFFAGLVGVGQGAIQALSRSLFSLLIPADKSTELFGFYNTVGRFAVVLGPLLIAGVGYIALMMGAQEIEALRIGMSSLVILFVLGLLFLLAAPLSQIDTI